MRKKWITLCFILATLALLAVATVRAALIAPDEDLGAGTSTALSTSTSTALSTGASTALSTGASTALSTEFTYQGQLNLDGQPVDDTCDLQFSLYDDELGATQVGVTQTITGVQVSGGLFTAQLDFGASAFQGDARWLGIRVQCQGEADYTDLGLQALSAAPYALYALGAPWDGISDVPAGFADGVDDVNEGDVTGIHAGEGLSGGGISGTVTLTVDFAGGGAAATVARSDHNHPEYDPANLVVVAQSGGDYASVQAAIDSVSDASADNPYLVWVAPGVYSETVTLKPHVHLQGAGQGATVISSTVDGGQPVVRATIVLTHHVSLRDLTAVNSSPLTASVALLATDGPTQTLVADVTARAQGTGDYNYAIIALGSGSSVTLQDVTAVAENGARNYGLASGSGAMAILHGGTFVGRGGNATAGVHVSGSGTQMEAQSITALGEHSSNLNYGLYNGYGATTTLRSGVFTGRGGGSTSGICNCGFADATLKAENIVAVGEHSSNYNRGLNNEHQATLYGGTFTARAGSYAYGIYNYGGGANLEAADIVASAEDGSIRTDGLFGGATAQARVDSSQIINARLDSSTLYLAVSQLAGSINNDGGAWHCFQVYDESYNAVTCP